ncbi:TPA: hypothetical protein RUX66_001013 [Aeromonas dhakensis]|nr:hypothetical protein [Aeromonas dhakensis]
MDSKLKPMALQVAGWGLLHGGFFDLHSITGLLGVSDTVASDVIVYLRRLSYIDTVAETRSCRRQPGKRSSHRVFIKIICIHQEQAPRLEKVPPDPKWKMIQQQLTKLMKFMPSPSKG